MASAERGFREILPSIEFCCWVVVVLAPVLRLINGAAVTGDQFVVQCAVFGAALTGAIALRAYRWRRCRVSRRR